jgi:hypothetical protein
MNRAIFTIYLCLVLAATVLPQTVEWKAIVLLHSTRNDVEKLLGKPIDKNLDLYDTEKERVTVFYSKGTCRENKKGVWNVPKDTVLGILVAPKEELNVAVVKEQLNQQFEKERDMEIQNVYIYFSKDNSIEFQTRLLLNGVEDVSFVAYSPGESGKNLLCKSRK